MSTLRPARSAESPLLWSLLQRSVRSLAPGHYSAEAIAAWAPATPDHPAWSRRLTGQTTLVVERLGQIAGFISYDHKGHIDLLYTDPDHVRCGMAGTLLRAAEDALRAEAQPRLTTAASRVAMPVFRRHGFEVVREERVHRNGVAISRYAMVKPLPMKPVADG
ncbi:GNAT family N-acetyltransferase [Abyssibacter profundi]|nr:GNAT family N-acetyltransferase [Abyssibacter profundi]